MQRTLSSLHHHLPKRAGVTKLLSVLQRRFCRNPATRSICPTSVPLVIHFRSCDSTLCAHQCWVLRETHWLHSLNGVGQPGSCCDTAGQVPGWCLSMKERDANGWWRHQLHPDSVTSPLDSSAGQVPPPWSKCKLLEQRRTIQNI